MEILPNGIGERLGDMLVVNAPLYVSGQVWYVHSGTGLDAGSPQGLSPEHPLATLTQALVNCAGGDIIVCLDGHEETVAATVDVNTVVTIVGSGQSNGLPTVKFTNNQGGAPAIRLIQRRCSVRNIMFPANALACTQPRLRVSDNECLVQGCYFECDGNDDGPVAGALQFDIGVERAMVLNTTFKSTATAANARPLVACGIPGSPYLFMRGVTFDGGQFGWEEYALVVSSGGAGPAAVRCEELSLLRGADVWFNGVSGFVSPTTVTGGSRVVWS